MDKFKQGNLVKYFVTGTTTHLCKFNGKPPLNVGSTSL